jgi:hypothetical protein
MFMQIKKYLLIILSIASCCVVKGQNIQTLKFFTGNISRIDSEITYKDTIPCMMLCQDTSHYFYDEFVVDPRQDSSSFVIHGHTVHQDFGKGANALMPIFRDGFEVREVNPCGTYDKNTQFAVYTPLPTYDHITFLDADKKPLPATIIIWMSKQIMP